MNTILEQADTVDKLTKDQITDLQTLLKAGGFYKGRIDGGNGPNTENAVKDFKKFEENLQASLDVDPNSTMYAFQQAKENRVPEGFKPTSENTPPLQASFASAAGSITRPAIEFSITPTA